MKLLVIGYGNDLRGDDGIGPMVAREVNRWNHPDIRAVEVSALVPELAAEMSQADAVIFVDACPCRDIVIAELRGRRKAGMGHISDPTDLLAMTQELYERSPRGWLVAVPGRNFDISPQLSPQAHAEVQRALQRIRQIQATLHVPPTWKANHA